jgi:hypothetical protein
MIVLLVAGVGALLLTFSSLLGGLLVLKYSRARQDTACCPYTGHAGDFLLNPLPHAFTDYSFSPKKKWTCTGTVLVC